MNRNPDSLLVGISGLSGSGKTFMLSHLKTALGANACFISMDDYYKPYEQQQQDEQGVTNFDLPDALEYERFITDVAQLLMGRPVMLRKYQFENFGAEEQFIQLDPAPIVIAEGLFVFHFPEVRNQMSLRFFIESDLAISLQRRLDRDTRERGITLERSRYQWDHHVMPGYQKYVLPWRDSCDLIIHNHGAPDAHISEMEQRIMEALSPEAMARLV